MDGGKSNHVVVIIIVIVVFLFVAGTVVIIAILVGLRRCQQIKHTKEQGKVCIVYIVYSLYASNVL